HDQNSLAAACRDTRTRHGSQPSGPLQETLQAVHSCECDRRPAVNPKSPARATHSAKPLHRTDRIHGNAHRLRERIAHTHFTDKRVGSPTNSRYASRAPSANRRFASRTTLVYPPARSRKRGAT